MPDSTGGRIAAGAPPAPPRSESGFGPAPAGGREDLRACALAYAAHCRRRLLRHLPARGERLLQLGAAPLGDPIERDLSLRFRTRYCVDDSLDALAEARRTIGDRGVFLNGAFLEIALDDDSFDGALCFQAIDRLDPAGREAAVRKLLRVTRPGGTVVIALSRDRMLGAIRRALREHDRPRHRSAAAAAGRIAATRRDSRRIHLSWYRRFEDVARVRFLPGRSLATRTQLRWIPNGALGRGLLSALCRLEESFPRFFAGRAVEPLVVLTRTPAAPKPIPDGYPPVPPSGGRAVRRLFV